MALPMFQTTSFKDGGPLGGFLSGMQDSYSVANADRDLVDRDRRSRFDQLRLEDEEMNTPVKAAERAKKLAAAEFETEEYTSGRKREMSEAERDIKLQQAIQGKNDNQKKELEMQAQGLIQASDMLRDDLMQDPIQAQALWDEARKVQERHGIKNVPAVYSQSALQKLKMGAKAATMTSAHIAKMREQESQNSFTASQNELLRKSTEGIQNRHDEANVAAAELRSAAAVPADARMDKSEESRRMYLVLEKKMKAGEKLTEAEVEQYLGVSGDKDNKLKDHYDKLFPSLVTEYQGNKDERTRIATKLGNPNMGVRELADTVATAMAEKRIRKEELRKFHGAIIRKEDGSEVRVSHGEEIPIGGPTPGAASNAPASSPVAPPSAASAPMQESSIDRYLRTAGQAPTVEPEMGVEGVGAEFGGGAGMGGSAPMTPNARPPAAPAPKAKAPIRVTSMAEARKLPRGTIFIDPNGVERKVP